MKCLEREHLFSYAYHLAGEREAARVRAHLKACAQCREVVENYARLDAALEEWKATEPSPWFEARLCQAIKAEKARRASRGFWSREWARGLALASLAILVVGGVVWLTYGRHGLPGRSTLAGRVPAQRVARVTRLKSAPPALTRSEGLSNSARQLESSGASSLADEDAEALDDYDLAANFDVLSELPKGESRLAD